jgi:hypothetical protein
MPYAKAIAALVVPVIMYPLTLIGIRPDSTVEEAITIGVTALFTAIAVYFVPNKR